MTVLEVDTLRNHFGAWPRWTLRVRDLRILGDATLEVRTFRSPMAHVLRHWRLPEGRGQVVQVSFIGLPYELGYEVQVPVLLLRGGESLIRVEAPAGGQ